MSIEVTPIGPETATYPRAYRNRSREHVVVFTSSKVGVVVVASKQAGVYHRPIGYYCDFWVECTDKDTWEPVDIAIRHD